MRYNSTQGISLRFFCVFYFASFAFKQLLFNRKETQSEDAKKREEFCKIMALSERVSIVRRVRSKAIKPQSRWWRYGPLIVWMAVIFLASTGTMSASNTSGLLQKLLDGLFGAPLAEEQLRFWHILLRKGGHFAEYAVLAVLAVRAFITSSRGLLRRHAALAAFLLIAVYAFLDEFHQSFVPSRGASVYDSLIDIAGGTAALAVWSLFITIRKRRLNTALK